MAQVFRGGKQDLRVRLAEEVKNLHRELGNRIADALRDSGYDFVKIVKILKVFPYVLGIRGVIALVRASNGGYVYSLYTRGRVDIGGVDIGGFRVDALLSSNGYIEIEMEDINICRLSITIKIDPRRVVAYCLSLYGWEHPLLYFRYCSDGGIIDMADYSSYVEEKELESLVNMLHKKRNTIVKIVEDVLKTPINIEGIVRFVEEMIAEKMTRAHLNEYEITRLLYILALLPSIKKT